MPFLNSAPPRPPPRLLQGMLFFFFCVKSKGRRGTSGHPLSSTEAH
ncbi:unnamed protein product [Nyctereutes procyonoides]|uniref:(raccoon dog) hypothetical protein n=1 Tax=Nyctereutes procyonoides TaxID=34880 RepID=A0A811Z0M3_NYCPR|nr:unnamed protein product [Nyctereutes procyonoides]